MTSYKEDPEILGLVDESAETNFVFYAQTKHQRMQFLKMQRNNNMYNQFQKMPGNPLMQMMMMRNRMGMGGMGMPFGNRGGFNPMMGMGMNMNMPRGGDSMMSMMGGMGMMQGGQEPMSSMNPMGQMPRQPGMGMNPPMEMRTPQMFPPNQNLSSGMSLLTSQMGGLSIPTPSVSSINSIGQQTPQIPFPSMNPQSAPPQSVITSEEAPQSQEEWELIGKTEDLSTQNRIIEKYQAEFSELPVNFQLQMLGDLIYSALQDYKLDEGQRSQITGIINDYDVLNLKEILELLSNPEVMKERINEALELINGEDGDEEEDDE